MSVRTISARWDRLGAALAILSVGIAYWLMADLALALSRPTGVAALWPAAGVATGVLMVAGPAARPWIAAAVVVTSFHVSLATGHTWPAAAVFGACNALEAVAVAAACSRSGQGQDALARPAAAFVFVACAALASAVAGLAGAVALIGIEAVEAPLVRLWFNWAAGDTVGIVAVAPAVLALARWRARGGPLLTPEGVAGLAALLCASVLIYGQPSTSGHWTLVAPGTVLLPLVIWIGLRGDDTAATLGCAGCALAVVWCTAQGFGPYAQEVLPLDSRLAATRAVLAELGLCTLILRAVSNQRAEELALERHRAFHDDLTGLRNRAYLYDALGAHLGRSGSALVLLDLDRFKEVNDTLGHLAGDEFLKMVAAHLQAGFGGRGALVRLGGDEFALLCDGVGGDAALLALAEEMGRALAQPFAVAGARLHGAASLGASFVQPGDGGADDVIRRADMALYASKRAGGACARLYDAEMKARTQARIQVEADLRAGMAQGQFVLHYQSLHDVTNGRLEGFEALMRWRHPERGLVGPDEFIRAAEEAGLIGALGRWALHEACAAAASWSRPVGVAVNVSPAQVVAGSLPADVRSALAAAGLTPSRLTVEITETLVVEDRDDVAAALAALGALGVRIALDDFGKGHSNLSCLRRLPVDVIKVDRSFARGMVDNSSDALIVEAIVGLAKGLRKQVTVEGIETAAQLDAIRALGVDTAQGFLFSRPVPGQQVPQLIVLHEGPRTTIIDLPRGTS